MDVMALRTWGIAVSAAAIAGLTTFALTAADRPAAGEIMEQGAPGQSDAPVRSDDVLFETAEAPAPAARGGAAMGFLVRFQGGGPMARAQAQAARGQERPAQRAIEAQLARQAQFRGLCFDRFTVGAAEVVLRTCAPVPQREQARISAEWLARLNAMPGVAYADANATVAQDRAP